MPFTGSVFIHNYRAHLTGGALKPGALIARLLKKVTVKDITTSFRSPEIGSRGCVAALM